MIWNDERVELLKKLWAEGLSASQIAGRLGGVTRNSVIGKVHRLGLSGRVTTSRVRKAREAGRQQQKRDERGRFAAMVRAISEARKEALALPPAPPVLEPEEPESVEDEAEPASVISGVAFNDLRTDHCRWPLGEKYAVATHYCGCPKTPGKPYCPSHCVDAFQIRQRRRPARPVIRSNELKLPEMEVETL